jgi:methionyl aminopeptidase
MADRYAAAMTVEDDDDLTGLRRAGRAVADARDTMLAAIEPGITTAELDRIGRRVLKSHGARSAPRLAYGFPGTACISVNDCVAHGIPSRRVVLRDGDLVNVDVSAELDGYWADTGASAPVGVASPLVTRLLEATRAAQRDGMRAARAGRRRREIGAAVERRARRSGFSVIANLCGHGVGRNIHEDPSVPNVDDRRDRLVLWDGLVLAIEPFLSTGARLAVEDDDGWSLRTIDGGLAAQFEHTVVVTAGEPLVLTASTA